MRGGAEQRPIYAAAGSLGDIQSHARYDPRRGQSRRGQVEKTLRTVAMLVLACGLGFWAYYLLKTAPRAKA